VQLRDERRDKRKIFASLIVPEFNSGTSGVLGRISRLSGYHTMASPGVYAPNGFLLPPYPLVMRPVVFLDRQVVVG
jgi:hypothetical protein